MNNIRHCIHDLDYQLQRNKRFSMWCSIKVGDIVSINGTLRIALLNTVKNLTIPQKSAGTAIVVPKVHGIGETVYDFNGCQFNFKIIKRATKETKRYVKNFWKLFPEHYEHWKRGGCV